MVPALAHTFLKVHSIQVSWPFKLGLLLLEATCQATALEFSRLKDCCCPRGIKDLRECVDSAAHCLTAWFLTVVRELAAQVDWSNFDQEVHHARMKAVLNRALGAAVRHEHAAVVGLAGQMLDRH